MDAPSAFAEILENLPRQHLRTRFRSRFGTEASDFDEKTFARGTLPQTLDRRLGHLLQEEPEGLRGVLLTGTADALRATNLQPTAHDALEALFGEGEGDRLLVVHGKTARLVAYHRAGEPTAWVRRIAVPKEERPGAPPKRPVLSRRQRAAAAGKTKAAKKGPPRRRR